MAKKEKKMNSRQVAYQKKQEQQGNNVVNWIIGILILCAVVYSAFMIYSYA